MGLLNKIKSLRLSHYLHPQALIGKIISNWENKKSLLQTVLKTASLQSKISSLSDQLSKKIEETEKRIKADFCSRCDKQAKDIESNRHNFDKQIKDFELKTENLQKVNACLETKLESNITTTNETLAKENAVLKGFSSKLVNFKATSGYHNVSF